MSEIQLHSGSGGANLRRRGRGAGLGGVLVEREEELGVLEQRLADARDGCGGVIVIEGPAGKGKSRLLTIAGDMARKCDMLVLGAQATELERDFPFGVAIQLFEPRFMAADEPMRRRLLAGPARRAGELLAGTLPEAASPSGDQAYGVIHALFRLLSNLATPPEDDTAPEPLVMLVDDAHWADRPSLRFLAYAAERLTELPVLLVVAVRAGERGADAPALLALRRAAERDVLRPESLSRDGVSEIVLSRLPDAAPTFCHACARVTGGNPFLLTKLLDHVEADGLPPDAATAARLEEMAPESVLDAVVAHLGALSPEAELVATAVAVLGDGAQLPRVAELTGLPLHEAGRAADELAAAHFFHPGSPLSFVHPLIASAIKASMSPLDRGRSHCQAASILADDEAPPEQVAVHLLLCPAQSDTRAVEILRAAARKALGSGAVDSAVRMLERALAEDPPPETYPEILAELGQAESAAGLPQAVDRLQDAIKATDERPRRAELALAQGRALHDQGRYREAAEVLRAAREETDREEAPDELEAAYIGAALHVPELAEEARAAGDRMVDRLTEPPSRIHRQAIAHLAMHHSLRGAPRQHVRTLAAWSWGEGALQEAEVPGGAGWPLLTGALLFADELELDLTICDAALELARDRNSPAAHAVASYCRVWPLYEQGRITEAAAAAQAAIDADPEVPETYLRPAYGAIACCHLQGGQLTQAETALSIIDHPGVGDGAHLPFLLDVRAQLRLAQLRHEEALADSLEAGRRLEGGAGPGALAWRSTVALALLALGDHDRARELAAEELEEARRYEITRVVIRDLRVLGLAERGERGIKLLRQAVKTGERYPPRLEHIKALIDLGGALRRANQRMAAREPLRQALELSHRGGAVALEDRARAELTATGARPRREMLSGLASLTPSELRVGELAARGLTTRQVAEILFVTPKTVEFHLRHIYRKLDVSSRAELTELLGTGNADS